MIAFRTICGLLCAAALVAPAAVMAQQDASELSAEQIEALFESQRTRGLVLAPTEEPATAPTVEDPAGTAVAAADPSYVELPDDVQVNIRIAFEFDSAALQDSEKAKLDALCAAMQNSDVPVFRIVGHTDASGSDSYNQRLSLLRAEEVQRFLVNDCGIAPERLEAVGVGEAFPFDEADPRSDLNRRVEFQVGA